MFYNESVNNNIVNTMTKKINCWANTNDIEKAKLFQDKGFLLGSYENKYLYDSSYFSTVLFANVGYGKGIGFVIPNLLSWQESAIIHDVESEGYDLTRHYRENILKQKIYRFNPLDNNSNCYNPLDWLSVNNLDLFNEVDKIISILITKDDFISIKAKNLLKALILSLIKEKKATFGEIVRILKTEDLENYFSKTKDTNNLLKSFLEEKDKKQIILVALESLKLWENPIIDKITSKSDFNIADFNENPNTLYVNTNVNNIEYLQPLFKIFYQQCISILTTKRSSKKGVLLILDEIHTIGKIPNLINSLAYTRGFKLKVCLITTSIDKLKQVYNENEVNDIFSICGIFITYGFSSINTANMFYNAISNEDIALQDIVNIDRKEEIIIYDRINIKCNKIKYYSDKDFLDKVPKNVLR